MVKEYEVLDFEVHPDNRGNLTALTNGQEIPFDIKRVYYTWGMPKDAIRGGHAHKNLDEVIVCVSGSCDFILDDGKTKTVVTLDKPNKGLYIKASLWREFTNFSVDCVVVLIASDEYDKNDYILDYNEYIKTRASYDE